MFEGKVTKALRFINNDEDAAIGAMQCSPEVLLRTLKDKHPDGKQADPDPEVLLPASAEPPDQVILDAIDSDAFMRCTKSVSGSGGPTKVDADICSRFYGNHSSELASAIANLAKILCKDDTPSEWTWTEELFAGRLIPLEKKGGGVRPIGIGKVGGGANGIKWHKMA